MGIRIHRMMGYGLTDFKGPDEDPRVNSASRVFEYEMSRRDTADYYQWRRDLGESDMGSVMETAFKGAYRPSLQDCFEWGTVDGGLENVFIVRPLGCDDWYRYDNGIDYAEQTYFSDDNEQRDDVRVSEYAPYPFDSYMDARTGEPVKDAHVLVQLRRIWRDRPEELSLTERVDTGIFTAAGGFSTYAEVEEFLVPWVPEDVRRTCEFAEVFTDPAHALTLRPMLYTWWS